MKNIKEEKSKIIRPVNVISSIEKKKAITDAIAGIEKSYGKGSIMRMGDAPIQKIDAISTGCLSLDLALGIGGVPRGRVSEIFGMESAGKSSLCLHIIAEAQKKGGYAAYIDTEHACDLSYSEKLGVDIQNLYLSQPDYGEQALEITESLIRSSCFDIVVVDSVAALVPKAEIEGNMGDAQMASQARLMSQALRKLTGIVASTKTCLIFVNQIRQKIGVVWGPNETTTGGNALKFYASVRMDIRRIGAIKSGDETIGNRTRVKIVKNKVAPPFKEVEFDILYNEGISKEGDLLDTGINLDLINKSGAWINYGESRWQGREAFIKALKEDPLFFDTLRQEIVEKILTVKKSNIFKV